MNRRDFHRLGMAALGGMLACTASSCVGNKKSADAELPSDAKDPDKSPWLQEPHICRGLNACKGLGKGKKNTCAGTSACAIAKAHTCGGDNECAGQGGCGEHPGENKCKGMGACHVPLQDEAWAKARKSF